jgi:hypothetical protein
MHKQNQHECTAAKRNMMESKAAHEKRQSKPQICIRAMSKERERESARERERERAHGEEDGDRNGMGSEWYRSLQSTTRFQVMVAGSMSNRAKRTRSSGVSSPTCTRERVTSGGRKKKIERKRFANVGTQSYNYTHFTNQDNLTKKKKTFAHRFALIDAHLD